MSLPDDSPIPNSSLDPARPGLAWSNHSWQLRLLGRPSLVAQLPGRTIVLRPKDAALLAIVALSGGIQADHLAAMLWPGASARQADNSLRQRLFRLRREASNPLVTTDARLQLASDVGTDIGPTLNEILEDESAGQDELLGDLEFDDLLKNPQFKSAYLAALGPKAKEKWLREMTNSSLVRNVKLDGVDYQVAAPCKPHDCGDNNLLVIYSPTKGAVYGSLHEKGRTTLIGAPGPALGAELERMWTKEFRQK